MTKPGGVELLDTAAATQIVDQLHFPEALRWHNGELWFSDIFGGTVSRVQQGRAQPFADIDGLPSGIGWMPDGTLLVVSMERRAVVAVGSDGRQRVHADLSHIMDQFANDMVVDAVGRAYVGNYGFDVDAGAPVEPTRLVRIDPDGSVHVETPEVIFPNGMVLVDDGRTLLVAETLGDRVTALDVAADGGLGNPQVVATFPPGSGPDGICTDAWGRVWVPCAYGGKVVAVERDGTAAVEIQLPDECVTCCATDGEDGHTLYVALAPLDESEAARVKRGRILAFAL
jgi:sugar lactone lactonase YvrE